MIKLASFGALALLAALVGGCCNPTLYGRLERMNPNGLASYPLATPDPRREADLRGQRLVVSWALPPQVKLSQRQCVLDVDLVFTGGQSEKIQIRVDRYFGHWEYELTGEQYELKGGISTYFLSIIDQGQVIRTFEHKLYKPLINIDELHESIEESTFNEF